MSTYDLAHRAFDYFAGFGNRETQGRLEKYTRELRIGEECRRALRTLRTRKTIRFVSNSALNLAELCNAYLIIKTGIPETLMYSVIIEIIRFAGNYAHDNINEGELKALTEELHQIGHESWISIVEEAKRNLDERS